jgi:hypothetical protein
VFLDVLVAALVVAFPALAIGVLLAPLCGRGRIAWSLGPVLGLACMVIALRALSTAGASGGLKTGLILAAGVVAALLAAIQRRPLLPFVGPSLAALGVLVLLAWPLAGRDGGTILGYNISNDSAFHAMTAQWLADGQPDIPSGASAVRIEDDVSSGYPAGGHELVALAIPLEPDGIWGAYQPVLAVIMAFGAFPGWWALRRVGASPGVAALGGLFAAAGYLQYAFYSEALLPQMAATPFVFGALGLAVEGVLTRRLLPFVLGGVTAIAAMLTYSMGLAIYLGPLYALALVLLVLRSPWRGRLVLSLGVVVLVGVVLGLTAFRSVVDQSYDFIEEARAVIDDPTPGHLPGPADRRLVWGSWVGTDFRFPYERWRVTEWGIGIAVALAIVGAAWCLLRRRLALLALLGAALGGYALLRHEGAGIYWIAKSYQVLAYPAALAVCAGAAAVATQRPRRLVYLGPAVAAILLSAYGFAVWRSLEYARAGTSYANPEITQLGDFASAHGHQLGVELVFDDLAKTEQRTAYNPFDPTYAGTVPPYKVGRTPKTRVPDLDSLPADYLDRFDFIIERRLGGMTQPPPPFRLAQQTDDFRLWVRDAAGALPARRPAELPGHEGGVVVEPGGNLGLADASWNRVLVGVRPLDGWYLPISEFETVDTVWSPWDGTGGMHYASFSYGTGPATYDLDVPVAGRYRISVMGSMAPSFYAVINGQTLRPPVATGMENHDGGQYLGTVELPAGRHRLELWSPDGLTKVRNLSFVESVSVEREDPPAPSPVCINGRRYEAASGQPVETDADAGSVAIENCGDVPLFVDWVEPLAS